MILANKMVSVNLFMPILMVILYQYMFKGQDGMKDMILFMVLPMIPAMTGYLLPIVVGEEAEKNNQRSLQLAGVKNWEYVVASLIIPFLVNLFYLFALPLYLGMDLVELGWQYIPVMLVTSLTVFLVFMGTALVVNTQSKATIGAMPIMMVTMLIQTKLNPAPPDPIQAKVMMMMPILFTFMFLWFPAGLVLYWVVNNTLSIAQQWQINRMIAAGGKPAE